MGYAARVGMCIDSIKCQGKCIQVMAVRCMQDMYVRIRDFEEVINPEIVEGLVNRAVVKALKSK